MFSLECKDKISKAFPEQSNANCVDLWNNPKNGTIFLVFTSLEGLLLQINQKFKTQTFLTLGDPSAYTKFVLSILKFCVNSISFKYTQIFLRTLKWANLFSKISLLCGLKKMSHLKFFLNILETNFVSADGLGMSQKIFLTSIQGFRFGLLLIWNRYCTHWRSKLYICWSRPTVLGPL